MALRSGYGPLFHFRCWRCLFRRSGRARHDTCRLPSSQSVFTPHPWLEDHGSGSALTGSSPVPTSTREHPQPPSSSTSCCPSPLNKRASAAGSSSSPTAADVSPLLWSQRGGCSLPDFDCYGSPSDPSLAAFCHRLNAAAPPEGRPTVGGRVRRAPPSSLLLEARANAIVHA